MKRVLSLWLSSQSTLQLVHSMRSVLFNCGDTSSIDINGPSQFADQVPRSSV
jgi:hypothetical protein